MQALSGPWGPRAANTAEWALPSPADPGCFSTCIVSSGRTGGAVHMLLHVTPNTDARSERIAGAAVAVSRSLHAYHHCFRPDQVENTESSWPHAFDSFQQNLMYGSRCIPINSLLHRLQIRYQNGTSYFWVNVASFASKLHAYVRDCSIIWNMRCDVPQTHACRGRRQHTWQHQEQETRQALGGGGSRHGSWGSWRLPHVPHPHTRGRCACCTVDLQPRTLQGTRG